MQSTGKLFAGAAGLTSAFVAAGFAKDKFNQVNIDSFYTNVAIAEFLVIFIIIIKFNQINIDIFGTIVSWYLVTD